MVVSNKIRDVLLADLPQAGQQLKDKLFADNFHPDCVVYLESGGRLIAQEFCKIAQIGAIPLKIQRKGGKWKAKIAKALSVMPPAVTNTLRRLEARFLWRSAPSNRVVRDLPQIDLSGLRVLILDDAVDSGASVTLAREWALSMGSDASNIKIAAITVTTSAARPFVQYYLYSEMCRFPWSSDSTERQQYEAIYNRTSVPAFTRRLV